IQRAGIDPDHRKSCQSESCIDRALPWCKFGSAAQTGPEACILGSSRDSEEATAGSCGSSRWTDGSTADPGRQHTDEEQSVETCIPCAERLVTDVVLSHRGPCVANTTASVRSFSDLLMCVQYR